MKLVEIAGICIKRNTKHRLNSLFKVNYSGNIVNSFAIRNFHKNTQILNIKHLQNFKSLCTLNNSGKRNYSKLTKMSDVKKFVNFEIESNPIIIFSTTTCPYCKKVEEYFKSKNLQYKSYQFDKENDGPIVRKYFIEDLKLKTVPQIYINGFHISGSDVLLKEDEMGLVDTKLKMNHKFDYDVIIIGGGSGGLAASSRAASFGFRVAVIDYVQPTQHGTKWGVGGTCVNVGCIPKKLWHTSALHKHSAKDSQFYGWEKSESNFNFAKIAENISNYIKSLNYSYRLRFKDEGIKYYKALGVFKDKNKIELKHPNGKTEIISSKYVIVAAGGRPIYPDNLGPNAQKLGISSDDLFWLKKPPGKTLVVGGSYIALECAGFLAHCGYQTDLMIRSILLRGFDQQIAELIYDNMNTIGNLKTYRPFILTSMEESTNANSVDASKKRIKITAKSTKDNSNAITEEYDTVLFAIGRYPLTQQLDLEKLGIQLKNGFIVDKNETTAVNNIFAIGDVLYQKPQLTPVAIKAGQLLVDRMFTKSKTITNYNIIPTTVFTPIEYGFIGLSEEDAISKYGQEDIEVYHTHFTPLEWAIVENNENKCYCKLICIKSQNEKIIGFHYLGPNAGEVTQGYAVAMTVGVTKSHFDETIGIHPTCSEILLSLTVTKSSGKNFAKSGC
ncbi:GRase [Intoshia linei]|uniref:thioredoxin-disulfide reductase (NADPH) n=1 Tax=Intoshia linei TaxID=1819745 RepID=A0A177BF20_9BILA|nr:GRase [Intoshia linei]